MFLAMLEVECYRLTNRAFRPTTGFRIKYSPSKILEELWLYLHFPLHLSLILLLEGIKNVFSTQNPSSSTMQSGDV